MSADLQARDSVLQLAGRAQFSDTGGAGLSAPDQAELLERMAIAKETAGMTARGFRALDRQQLADFCSRFDFTPAEVRLGQRLVELIWHMWRVTKTAKFVVRERRKRSIQ